MGGGMKVQLGTKINNIALKVGREAYENKITKMAYRVGADIVGVVAKDVLGMKDYKVGAIRKRIENEINYGPYILQGFALRHDEKRAEAEMKNTFRGYKALSSPFDRLLREGFSGIDSHPYGWLDNKDYNFWVVMASQADSEHVNSWDEIQRIAYLAYREYNKDMARLISNISVADLCAGKSWYKKPFEFIIHPGGKNDLIPGSFWWNSPVSFSWLDGGLWEDKRGNEVTHNIEQATAPRYKFGPKDIIPEAKRD